MWLRIVSGCVTALRRAGLAALTIVLAVLVAMPAPAKSQPIGRLPVFSPSTPLTFLISEGARAGEVIGTLPAARDADQNDDEIIYSLWDRDDPIVHGSTDAQGYGDGDAAAFGLGRDFYYDPENDEGKVRVWS